MPFFDVRDPQTKQLLFQYDPQTEMVRVKRKNGALREVHLPSVRARYEQQQKTLLSTPEYLPMSTDRVPD